MEAAGGIPPLTLLPPAAPIQVKGICARAGLATDSSPQTSAVEDRADMELHLAVNRGNQMVDEDGGDDGGVNASEILCCIWR